MTEPHRHTANFTDNGTPVAINLDLSRIATDEQVITREDWAAIPALLGLPEVDPEEWAMFGPIDTEFVKRNGKWTIVSLRTDRVMTTFHGPAAAICDLAVPLLTARDSRVPEVGQ